MRLGVFDYLILTGVGISYNPKPDLIDVFDYLILTGVGIAYLDIHQ